MGSSIPLPALHLNPPPVAPDALDQYARLQQLSQAQQMAPLRQQAAQQQVQQGQLDIQQKQQQLSDQKAMTTAMTQWDGKDLNELAPLVLKNGGSAQAVMGLKQKSLEMQQTYSNIAKDDAATGASNLDTQLKKNNLLAGAFTTVMQTPDAQLPQTLMSTAQDLAQKGLLDPQHAQAAAQLAQSGDPNSIRQQLDVMRKGLMGQTQIMQEAKDNASISSDQATADQKKLETGWYQQHGGAPGVPVEAQQQADWLQKNPGKTASDYVVWKAQHSPTMIMQGMSSGVAGAPSFQAQAGGTDWGKVAQRYGLSQDAFDQQAEKYYQTGQLPPIGRGSGSVIAQNRDLMNRAADLHPNASLAANSAEFKANADSLKKLQTNFDQVQAFESTAEKNMNLLQQTAQQIPDLGARFLNVPVRMINDKMIGTANMSSFKTALATAQTEAAKVLNSSNASGVLSDSSRHELQDIVDGNKPLPAMIASLNTLKQDMANRTTAYQQQIADIQTRLKGTGSSGGAPAKPANDPFAQFGGTAHQ